MTKGDYAREMAKYLASCNDEELAYAITELYTNGKNCNEMLKRQIKAEIRVENENECTSEDEALLKRIREENAKREQTDIEKDKEFLERMKGVDEIMKMFADALSM